jgi:[1-hydroxy-2-(trimethylamino)ethyl]phosphonate dioxygenase
MTGWDLIDPRDQTIAREAGMDLSTERIFQLLDSRGTGRYGLSAVTQKEHALQSADLATKRGLGDALVIAALFHDLGHLLVGDDVNLAQRGVDDLHEETSANALAKLFGNDVAEPVRLHVAAKRYLCAVNPAYYDKLSEDSRQSLLLQGGPMSPLEVAAFDKLEHRAAALALRMIDDEAKVAGQKTPGLDSYRATASRLQKAHA